MRIKKVDFDLPAFLRECDVDSGGIAIMSKKGEVHTFHITDIRCGAANILKQDALSKGADFALPYGTIECQNSKKEGVLIGTSAQLQKLAQGLKAQPYGLKDIGAQLQLFLKHTRFLFKIMGVVNTNQDSFNPGSRFQGSDAIRQIETMIADGADIIDLGGVSSRPGSKPVPVAKELARVTPVIDLIKKRRLQEKAVFSIDTFVPEVAEHALENGFGIVNDITGLSDERIGRLCAKYGAKLCIMHMQNDPSTMQQNPRYEDVILEVEDFFHARLQKAYDCGLRTNDIILDVGIGFGKSLEHNLTLLNSHTHFQKFGCELLVGASRKSMIDKIHPSSVSQRLPGTLAAHIKAYQNGANIIRAHDVKEHRQAFDVLQAIEKQTIP
ncbi:MAG: dihydropteroate synthase [Campylobacterota bacterium]